MKKLLLLFLLISNLLNAQVLETFPSTSTLQEPSNFINFNNKMFYFARDASYEFALYATDGTTAENQIIKSLGFAFGSNLTDKNAFNDYKIIYKNKLYFNFSNTLYESDGTTAGTKIFMSSLLNAKYFKIFNDRLYFITVSGDYGAEIWSTDGTVAGTKLLKDINPGYTSAFNYVVYGPHFTIFNNKLFFVANDAVHGYELWSTDGTEAGTSLFKDIRTTDGDDPVGYGGFAWETYSEPNFKVVGNKMYFGANPHITSVENYMVGDSPILYETDGTPEGTFFVQPPLDPRYNYNYLYDVRGMTVIDDKLFVFCRQAFHDFQGIKNGGIYLVDASKPISRLIELVGNAGDAGTNEDVERYSMRPFNGEYYFLGKTYDNTDAINLWKMNPTDYSFTKITQATNLTNPDFSDSNISLNLLVAKEIDNKLFFVKTDISAGQIFSTDGTVSGTQFQAKSSSNNHVNTTQYAQGMSVIPSSLFSFNNALYFKAQFALGQPNGLWRLNFTSLSNSNFEKIENNIYPNPTNGIVNISSTENLKSVQVFDILGKQILEKNIFSTQTQLDLSNFISGVYLLKIESKNGKIKTQKIIKK